MPPLSTLLSSYNYIKLLIEVINPKSSCDHHSRVEVWIFSSPAIAQSTTLVLWFPKKPYCVPSSPLYLSVSAITDLNTIVKCCITENKEQKQQSPKVPSPLLCMFWFSWLENSNIGEAPEPQKKNYEVRKVLRSEHMKLLYYRGCRASNSLFWLAQFSSDGGLSQFCNQK